MADSTSVIKVDGTEDFTSLSAWFTAKEAVAGVHTAQLSNEQLSDSLITSSPVAATGFVVEPVSGAEHDGRHRTVSGTGAEVKSDATGAQPFNIFQAPSFDIQGISISPFSSGTTVAGVSYGSTSTGNLQFCILDGLSTTNTTGAIQATGAGVTLNAIANVMYNWGRAIDYRPSGNAAGNIYQNTANNCGALGVLAGTLANCKNNITVNSSSQDYFSTTANHDGNISEDATAAGASSHTSVEVLVTGGTPTKDYVAFVSITPGSENFALVDLEHITHNPVAIGGGVTGLGVANDNIGVAYGSPPAIGAFAFAAVVSAGGGGSRPFGFNRPTPFQF